jgi:hypothetical protein
MAEQPVTTVCRVPWAQRQHMLDQLMGTSGKASRMKHESLPDHFVNRVTVTGEPAPPPGHKAPWTFDTAVMTATYEQRVSTQG